MYGKIILNFETTVLNIFNFLEGALKNRIGIVGPPDSLSKILYVAREYEEAAEFVAIEYTRYEDVLKVVEEVQSKCDMLLFSGEGPYTVAKVNDVIKKPCVYIPREGTGLYRAVWEMNSKLESFANLSSDVVSPEVLKETMLELDVPFEKCYYLKYGFEKDMDTIIDFHKKMWHEKKVDACLTGFNYVQKTLENEGIKVFRVYPTNPLIRESIYKLILLGMVKKEKEGQIAIQIIRNRNLHEFEFEDYDFLMIHNRLEKTLIEYTRRCFGTMFPLGQGSFMVFTNRGAIDNIEEIVEAQFGNLGEGVIISSGIGYGYTVYEAERNAREALHHAMRKENTCIYLKDSDGTFSGPFMRGSDLWMDYQSVVSSDPRVTQIADQAGISATYVLKLRGLMKKINRQQVDSKIAADYLGITERSARRILGSLESVGLAQVTDEVSRSSTGRPRKVYLLKIES